MSRTVIMSRDKSSQRAAQYKPQKSKLIVETTRYSVYRRADTNSS